MHGPPRGGAQRAEQLLEAQGAHGGVHAAAHPAGRDEMSMASRWVTALQDDLVAPERRGPGVAPGRPALQYRLAPSSSVAPAPDEPTIHGRRSGWVSTGTDGEPDRAADGSSPWR